MPAKKIEGQCLIERLAGFNPVRAAGTMATVGLFILASTFLTGCVLKPVEKDAVAEAPVSAPSVVPKFRVVEGENKDDIAVWTEKNASGTHEIVMTGNAYNYIRQSESSMMNSAQSLHMTFEAFRQLDAACREIAILPSEKIAPEPKPEKYVSGTNTILAAFNRARANVIRAVRRNAAPVAIPPPEMPDMAPFPNGNSPKPSPKMGAGPWP